MSHQRPPYSPFMFPFNYGFPPPPMPGNMMPNQPRNGSNQMNMEQMPPMPYGMPPYGFPPFHMMYPPHPGSFFPHPEQMPMQRDALFQK